MGRLEQNNKRQGRTKPILSFVAASCTAMLFGYDKTNQIFNDSFGFGRVSGSSEPKIHVAGRISGTGSKSRSSQGVGRIDTAIPNETTNIICTSERFR